MILSLIKPSRAPDCPTLPFHVIEELLNDAHSNINFFLLVSKVGSSFFVPTTLRDDCLVSQTMLDHLVRERANTWTFRRVVVSFRERVAHTRRPFIKTTEARGIHDRKGDRFIVCIGRESLSRQCSSTRTPAHYLELNILIFNLNQTSDSSFSSSITFNESVNAIANLPK